MMKNNRAGHLLLGSLLLSLPGLRAQAQGAAWTHAQPIGGAADSWAADVAVDGRGDLLVAGYFEGVAQLDGTTTLSCPTGCRRNAYVAKYNARHDLLWARRAGDPVPGTSSTSQGAAINALATDASGAVYAVGYYTGRLLLANGVTGSAFGIRGFVAKFDGNGLAQWVRSIDDASGADVQSVAVLPGGDVVVGGFYGDQASLGGVTLSTRGDRDGFVARYDGSGSVLWARSLGGPGSDVVRGVGTDALGNVYVSGEFGATLTAGSLMLTSQGGTDGFLLRYTPQGTPGWARSFGGTGADAGRRLATDPAGDVYLTGFCEGTAAYGPGAALTSAGARDGLLLKYSAAGAALWGQVLGGAGDDEGSAVLAPANGVVYVAGAFQQTAQVGGSRLVSAGQRDVLLARFDGAGTAVWALGGGGPAGDLALALASRGPGALAVAGVYSSGSAQFGPLVAANGGGIDALVLAVQDNAPLATRPAGPAAGAAARLAYPNPARQELYLPPAAGSGPAELRDLQGRLVRRWVAGAGPLPVADLPRGLYLLSRPAAAGRRPEQVVLE